ncbi:ABC transporter substrate-binding protein [Cytophaga aurantiaca]|uniref:ABC transporter substrate-binding protein n=1 Tax=Cytophaga aurantiaca TaxID=29530 RepID=UPI0003761B34|nr:helical backbone metal receptor [Cytophaga aurantiaca]
MRYSKYLFLSLLIFCFACNSTVVETHEIKTRIVKDDLGRNVSVPVNPNRILSLTPSITELVYTFVDTTKIVGRSIWCDYPESVKKKPAVNSYPLDIEAIVRLKPDLILVKKGMISVQDINKLEQLHQTVFVQEYDLLKKIESSLRTMVDITKGDSVKMETWFSQLHIDTLNTIKKKKYLAVVSAAPIYVFGNLTFVSELCESLGGENIIHDVQNAYPTVDVEYILLANPELYIFSSEEQKKLFFESYPILKKTLGYKNDQLFVIDDSVLSRPGVRLPVLKDSLESIMRK